ncbi:hypothetical protein GO013_13240 [Pseudodesulfovibrio sp. JC047]|uniref:hypothetical protein n=1 Tax=Pseudodesulfovibrio sp. JC047 TaxID=2683199 RepID=UPI0013D34C41|nr:hypothetical protein [Pseudodesulfovibrio sp. JC047]NDV20375.1 hypothetical protein [Pseudodesulfovibrio sp. JC047]
MPKKVLILVQALLVLCLVGCSDKLSKETAKEVLEKDLIAKQSKRFRSITFEKGSAGFEYFQKMIAEGNFEFKKKEELWNVLSKEPLFEKIYLPKSELAGVFDKIIIRDDLTLTKATALEIMEKAMRGKHKLQRTVFCIVDCWITREEVQIIDSVLNDEKAGTAKVKFTIAEVPIAPYYEELLGLAKSDPKFLSRVFQLRKPYTTEAMLKRYDEGWTVESKFL